MVIESDWIGFIGFLTLVVFLVLYAYKSLIREREARRRLLEFTRSVSVDRGFISLPEMAQVERGIVKIKLYMERATGSRSSSRVPRLEVSMVNSLSIETRELKVSDICSYPFYIYVKKIGLLGLRDLDNIYVVAPGFIIRSGRFKSIIGLCLNPESIPARRLELNLSESYYEGVGVVELSSNSIKASTSWMLETPLTQRVVYDQKTGVYRVETQPLEKSDIRGVRLDICFPSARFTDCKTLSATKSPNTSSSGELSWRVKNKLLVTHERLMTKSLLYEIEQSIESSIRGDTIIAGYTPGEIKVKLVLDKPLKKDLIQEQTI